MKEIIVNGKFLTQRVTGVQRYAREILMELDKIISKNQLVLAVPHDAKEIPKYKNIKVVQVGKTKGIIWEQLEFPFYVKQQHGTSLNLCNVSPLFDPGITCIHDVKIKATPQYFSKKFLTWYNLLLTNTAIRAKKIITVSEFSKSEIIKYFKVKPNKIVVIPNAWQHYSGIQYDENTLDNYGLKKNQYYFAMGSMEPNKNFKWIAEMAKKNPMDDFAVAGSINKKIFAEGLGFECPDNMYLLGYVTDEEAKTLMRDCKAFLFPSFYEGFGIPPLEAVSAGAKKVVVSDIPVMHEIFGETANYINPVKNEKISVLHDIQRDVLNKYAWSLSAKKMQELLWQ